MKQFAFDGLRSVTRYIAAAAIVLATGVGSAFAQVDVSGGNQLTGPNSINDNLITATTTSDIVVADTATYANTFDILADTGTNLYEFNTLGGDLETGDVIGDVEIRNRSLGSGINFLGGWLGGQDIDVNLDNFLTGPFSVNTNDVLATNDTVISYTNDYVATNTVTADINTGNNVVTNNTEVGDIRTGDARFDVTIENRSNAGPALNLGGVLNPDVDVRLRNGTTGPNSENTNTVDVSRTTTIDITNTTDVVNDVAVTANTGGNTIDTNTVVGDIQTGDVRLGVDIVNETN